MATALQTVNEVLRRLREAQVTDFSGEYSQLILDFVNETKTEVEDAWDWFALRQTLSVDTQDNVQLYTLTGAGQRFRLYDKDGRIYDSTNDVFIWPSNSAYIEWNKWLTTTPKSKPNQYRFIGVDANLDPKFELFPVPDGVYTIKFPLVIPQADLVNTTDTYVMPKLPIILGAWARAIMERGEDKGTGALPQWDLYQNTLAAYIARDQALTKDETVWTPK